MLAVELAAHADHFLEDEALLYGQSSSSSISSSQTGAFDFAFDDEAVVIRVLRKESSATTTI